MSPAKAITYPVVNESRLRVRYAETDQMGVVYHSNHFIWFEVGRVELLRQLGFSYRDMEQDEMSYRGRGCALPLQGPGAFTTTKSSCALIMKNIRESLVHFGYELRAGGRWNTARRGRDHAHRGRLKQEDTTFPEKYLRLCVGQWEDSCCWRL